MDEKWITCCRGKGCPQIAVDSNFIYIKDDHGGQIKITASEYASISKQIRTEIALLLSKALADKQPQSRDALRSLFNKESADVTG